MPQTHPHPHSKPKKKKDPCACSGNSLVRSKGEYLIQVLRTGFTIASDLPYCIWGTIYANGNNFATVLQPYLPAGVTVTSKVDSVGVTFTYVSGCNSDTITVFADPDALLSYSEMLANLNTNYIQSELMYFSNNTEVLVLPTLTDQNNKILQNAPLYFQKIDGGGAKNNEYIKPLSRRIPNNSVPDITEISMRNQAIKPDTVWIHKFAYITQGGAFSTLQFSFMVVLNKIINMNDEKMSLMEIERDS